jgi:hypothetical protein
MAALGWHYHGSRSLSVVGGVEVYVVQQQCGRLRSTLWCGIRHLRFAAVHLLPHHTIDTTLSG